MSSDIEGFRLNIFRKFFDVSAEAISLLNFAFIE